MHERGRHATGSAKPRMIWGRAVLSLFTVRSPTHCFFANKPLKRA